MAAPKTARPPELRPVIDEIVRTQVCPSTATLLVDRISVIRTVKALRPGGDQTFRIWLTDGQKSIQGILKYELHPYLAAGHVREGSYVELSKYELAAARRLNGDGSVYILQIADFQDLGHDGRATQPVRLDDARPASSVSPGRDGAHAAVATATTSPSKHSTLSVGSPARISPPLQNSSRHDRDSGPVPPEDIFKSAEVSLVRTPAASKTAPGKTSPTPPPTQHKRKREPTCSPLEAISNNSSARPLKTCKLSTTLMLANPATTTSPAALTLTSTASASHPPLASAAIPPPLKQITRSLKITPLSKLIGARTVRNKIVDVLAVICSVDDTVIRRRNMPAQRNLRITDQSTAKHVQLTVFADAERFRPPVGTVALFRNVTTHEWDGGSLKAYVRECDGVQWFFPDPDRSESVDARVVSLLRHCWESRQEEERRMEEMGRESRAPS